VNARARARALVVVARVLVFAIIGTALLGSAVFSVACAGDAPTDAGDGPSDAGAGDAADSGVTDAGLHDGGDAEPFPVIDAACTTNGCIREANPLGTFSQSVIEEQLDDGVTIDNGYTITRITFVTDGRLARAVVTIPYPIAPPPSGYHVVVHNPGTVGVGDVCAVGDSVLGVGLSGYFGAYGFIGAALDYPGLGTDGAHPYLVSVVEGRAALDAARATLSLARMNLVPISRRVAIAGNSQGGHATLAAAREHMSYAAELDVGAFAAAAPASLSKGAWSAGVVVPGEHLIYHALVVYAWAAHYAHTGPPLFHDDVAATLDDVMETHCVASVTGAPSLFDALPHDAALLFDDAFLTAYAGGDLTAYDAIAIGFAENGFSAFTRAAPLLIYQGASDPVVLQSMTDALVAELESGGASVDYRVVDGAGHTDVAFGVVAFTQLRADESRAWIRARLDE
jgi:dienelactone hydrolase